MEQEKKQQEIIS